MVTSKFYRGVLVGLVSGLVSRFADGIIEGNKKDSLTRRRKLGRKIERKGRQRRKLWEGKDIRELGEILKNF